MSFRSFFWYLGKALQLLGLATVGFALFYGLKTHDSKQELSLLAMGAVEFMVGVLCLRGSSSPS